jgi:hypothetical protein
MNLNSCRVCFTGAKSKLLNLYSVKIEDKTLAEMVTFLTSLEVGLNQKMNKITEISIKFLDGNRRRTSKHDMCGMSVISDFSV